MANDAFTASLKNFLGVDTFAHIDPEDSGINGVFVDHADVTPNVDTHDAFDDINVGAQPAYASTPALTTKAITGTSKAVFDADDLVFVSFAVGDQVESLILYKHTGTQSTSPLWLFWDTATGLPLTPNGADVTVQWATVSGDTGGICVYG